jgi:glutaredoxin
MTVGVRLYGAPGCHLCEEARRLLEEERERFGFRLEEVDISTDPGLERAYRERIPVVEVAGREAFQYRVDRLELARLLTMAQASP